MTVKRAIMLADNKDKACRIRPEALTRLDLGHSLAFYPSQWRATLLGIIRQTRLRDSHVRTIKINSKFEARIFAGRWLRNQNWSKRGRSRACLRIGEVVGTVDKSIIELVNMLRLTVMNLFV